MNTRPNVNQQVADSVVRESLGLSMEDLGGNAPEDAFDAEGSDELNVGDDLGVNTNNNADDNFEEPEFQTRQPVVQDDLTVQPEPVRQPAPQPDRIPAQAEIRTDGKGNLIDRKTGQVVAKAGAEARMYQKMHKQTQELTQVRGAHQEVTTRLNKAVEIGTQLFERLKTLQENQGNFAPARYGLADNEAIEALNFAKQAKTDPVGAIKAVLTRAASNGIDLTSIGLTGGNFDPKSLMDLVRAEIGTAMNPLKERSQRETAQEQAQREANESVEASKKELNTFLQTNPDARQYLPVFQQVYSQPQFQHMSLGEVWAKLQLNLLRRGQTQPQQRPSNQQQRRNPRVPNGRQNPPNNGNQNTTMAPVDMSYEDIVRGLLPTK